MAGSNQAVNLTGMLNQLSQDIGGFADVQANYGNAIRNMARPDLDMDNVQSMNAYGQWLINNGKIAEGQAMMGQAANLKRKNRALEGEVAISKLASRWHTEEDPAEKQKISDAISNIAGSTGVSPEAVRSIMLKESLDIREQTRKETDTDSTVTYRSDSTANTRRQIDNNYDIANREIELNKRRLAETMRSNLAREGLTARSLDQDQAQFNANLQQRKNEFSLNYDLNVDRFEEEQRMNAHAVKIQDEQIRQGWAELDLNERRVVIAEQLKDNEISFTDFRKLMMGDENRRLNELQPYEIEVKKAGIKVALANAGYTEAQTERALYDLGFERSVRKYREDIVENEAELGAANVGLTEARTANVKADTVRTKADVDRVLADTKRIRAATDYQEAATEAVIADMYLDEKRYNLAERQQFWNEGMDEARLQLEERAQNSGIDLQSAQIQNLESLMQSRQFQDNMLAMEVMGKGVSDAYKAAYSMTFDVLNPKAVDNARIQFYNRYGAGALVDFDSALKEKIKLRQLQVDVQGLQQGLENKKPPTRASLKAAGFSDDVIETVINLPPAQRNQAILGEAQRLLEPATGGRVTQAHLDVVNDRAEEMVYATFGKDWWGPFPTGGNDIPDQEVIDKVKWALAEANAAGLPAHEAVNRGVAAMLPYLSEVGGGAVQNLDNFLKSMGAD
jgi:hypothetical protein